MLSVADPHATRRAAFRSLKERLAAVQRPAPPLERRLPCELPALDLALGGGLPIGLVTLEGAASSGRGAIAFRALAVASRSAFVALLDDGACYPPALVEAGVLLERLLIVPVREGRLLARALDTLLRSRVCRVVVVRARAWSAAIWGRFSQLARETGSTLLTFLDEGVHAPAGLPALRLRCRNEGFVLCGRGSVGSAFLGYTFCVEPLARTLPSRSPLSLQAMRASERMVLRERALRSASAPQRAAQMQSAI